MTTETCYECHAAEGEPVLYGATDSPRLVRHAVGCFFRGRPAP